MKKLSLLILALSSNLAMANTQLFPTLKGKIYTDNLVDLNDTVLQVRVACFSYGLFKVNPCGEVKGEVAIKADGSFEIPAMTLESKPLRRAVETKYRLTAMIMGKTYNYTSLIETHYDSPKEALKDYALLTEVSMLKMPSVLVNATSNVNCQAGSLNLKLKMKALLANGKEAIIQEMVAYGTYENAESHNPIFKLSHTPEKIVKFIGSKVTAADKMSFDVVIDQYSVTDIYKDSFVANSLSEGWERATSHLVITPSCEQ